MYGLHGLFYFRIVDNGNRCVFITLSHLRVEAKSFFCTLVAITGRPISRPHFLAVRYLVPTNRKRPGDPSNTFSHPLTPLQPLSLRHPRAPLDRRSNRCGNRLPAQIMHIVHPHVGHAAAVRQRPIVTPATNRGAAAPGPPEHARGRTDPFPACLGPLSRKQSGQGLERRAKKRRRGYTLRRGRSSATLRGRQVLPRPRLRERRGMHAVAPESCAVRQVRGPRAKWRLAWKMDRWTHMRGAR